jgi:hypothetical protein
VKIERIDVTPTRGAIQAQGLLRRGPGRRRGEEIGDWEYCACC